MIGPASRTRLWIGLGASVAIFEFGCQKAELGRAPSKFQKYSRSRRQKPRTEAVNIAPHHVQSMRDIFPHIPYLILPHILRLKTSLK